ncbi:MAG: YqgE/AlgH family protein [Paracoccaceae bacterium]
MDLTGKLLIAMPGMEDMRFEHSVVYLCSYSEKGAMGLIVNKVAEDLILRELLEQLEIEVEDPENAALPIHVGGPVETSRGFVLHTSDYDANLHSMQIDERFSMTTTLDILEDVAKGEGPDRALMMLGYAGWAPGQLEAEIALNGWLTVDASRELVFDKPDHEKWQAALQTIGVDPLSLSGSVGHA